MRLLAHDITTLKMGEIECVIIYLSAYLTTTGILQVPRLLRWQDMTNVPIGAVNERGKWL